MGVGFLDEFVVGYLNENNEIFYQRFTVGFNSEETERDILELFKEEHKNETYKIISIGRSTYFGQ